MSIGGVSERSATVGFLYNYAIEREILSIGIMVKGEKQIHVNYPWNSGFNEAIIMATITCFCCVFVVIGIVNSILIEVKGLCFHNMSLNSASIHPDSILLRCYTKGKRGFQRSMSSGGYQREQREREREGYVYAAPLARVVLTNGAEQRGLSLGVLSSSSI